jgi:hypothetical protein
MQHAKKFKKHLLHNWIRKAKPVEDDPAFVVKTFAPKFRIVKKKDAKDLPLFRKSSK